MVNRQIIASHLFSNRGKLSPTLMRSLMVRGCGVQVDDGLCRFGWDGEQGVITTIMTIDPEAGKITGVRFESRGRGPQVSFKARDLWKSVANDLTASLKIDSLRQIKWKNAGK